MKKFLVLLLVIAITEKLSAQNVGIGTTNPSARLEIAKPGGDTPTLNIHGSLNSSYFHFGSNEDTYIRGGKTSSNVILGDVGSGRVGIGTNNPITRLDIAGTNGWDLAVGEGDMRIGNSSYRLKFGVALAGGGVGAAGIMQSGGINLLSIGSNNNYQLQINGADNSVSISNNALLKFPAALSKKIILYPGSVGDAHIGVFSNELRISSDYSGADITFGYDNRSTGFTEKFRLKATGAVSVNGNVGAPGQVLSSNGSSSAPTWSSSTNTLYNNTVQLLSGLIEPAYNTEVAVPGLSYTFTVAGNCKVLVMPTLSIYAISCALCGDTYCSLKVYVDGALNSSWTRNANNGQYDSVSGSCIVNLGAGTHNIEIRVIAIGPSVRFGGNNPTVIQVIPQ
jgi:hypothetical protein